MFGAFIGGIVGSKYEFNNIKTKIFPLFSQDCDYTDDTIMTVAVAKAIMLSRTEQLEKMAKEWAFKNSSLRLCRTSAEGIQILPVRMAVVLQNGSGSKTRSLTEATETALPCVSHPADWRRLLWMKRWHWLVQVRA